MTGILERHPNVIWDEVDGHVVLCHTDTGEYFYLNDTGAFVWRACDGRRLASLLAEMEQSFPEADPSRLKVDVQAYVESLLSAGLVNERDRV